MSMSTFGSRSSPGPVRTAAADTSGPSPPRIMVRPMAGAPARVAAARGRLARRSRRMSLVREPTSARIRDWSAPLMNTPVESRRTAVAASPSASPRPRRRSSLVYSTPSLRNTCSYSACTSSGMPVAVVTSVIRARLPPHSSTNRSSTPEPQHLSSPPPMISKRPRDTASRACSSTVTLLPNVASHQPSVARATPSHGRPAVSGVLGSGIPAGAAGRAPPGSLRLPGQLFWDAQQWVSCARHDLARGLADACAAGPRCRPEQLERLPWAQPVPLGEDADGLLDPDPDRQRALKLRHGLLELLSVRGRYLCSVRPGALLAEAVLADTALACRLLAGTGRGGTWRIRVSWSCALSPGARRSAAFGVRAAPGRHHLVGRGVRNARHASRDRPLFLAGQFGREQIREHHGARQVGHLFVADLPSGGSPPRHGVLGNAYRGLALGVLACRVLTRGVLTRGALAQGGVGVARGRFRGLVLLGTVPGHGCTAATGVRPSGRWITLSIHPFTAGLFSRSFT